MMALFAWPELQQYLAATEAAVKEDVLTTHEVARQAAAGEDTELFRSLLSGRDDGWTEAQIKRMEQDLLFTPLPNSFGLHSLSDDGQIVNISLDPQHWEATLLVEQPHVVTDAQGITATVSLQQTYVYHRGRQRWLLSPPEASFWGQWQHVSGARLTLDYPQRDEVIARRLAADLEAKLLEMCQIPIPARVGCPSGLRLHVRLSTRPDSLLPLADPKAWLMSGTELELPAPTLVGVPTSEAAYQALFRDYAARVLSATITHVVGYHCCNQIAVYQAVLDKQLNQLGVRPWPLTPTYASGLVNHFVPLRELELAWLTPHPETLTEAERWLLYALVDLLVDERGIQPTHILTWRLSLSTWLSSANETAEDVWRAYHQRARSGDRPEQRMRIHLPNMY